MSNQMQELTKQHCENHLPIYRNRKPLIKGRN
jgi:hypothetical protein